MDKTKVVAGALIMIALFGLPAGVQAEGSGDGLVATDSQRKGIWQA